MQQMRLSVEQRLTLKLSLQLQQAIKLLQLTRLELSNLIQQEISENPLLEELPSEAMEEIPVPTLESTQASDEAGESGLVQQDDDSDWRKSLEELAQGGRIPTTITRIDEDMPSYESRVSRKDDLYDYLLWQLRLSKLTEDEQRIGIEIILDIDENGYIKPSIVGEIGQRLGVSVDKVEQVLHSVQRFDPPGIAARNLEECLSIQAEVLYPENRLLARIIQGHLNDLVGRSILALPARLGVSEEELEVARTLLTTLDPKPGRNYSSSEAQYVTPDVYVIKENGEYVCSYNDDGLPKLKLSSYYERLARKSDHEIDEKTKDYLRKKVSAAKWFLKSIHQRQNTVLRVAQSIVRFQRDFLDFGVSHLHPLILRDVADDIGMHEATISRVTSNKYMQTPQGLFSMKYFFKSRIESSDGEDLSSESVRERIKALVEAEDPRNPLSDQALVDMLGREGVQIARRTIAKYRTQLGILPSSQRVRAR